MLDGTFSHVAIFCFEARISLCTVFFCFNNLSVYILPCVTCFDFISTPVKLLYIIVYFSLKSHTSDPKILHIFPCYISTTFSIKNSIWKTNQKLFKNWQISIFSFFEHEQCVGCKIPSALKNPLWEIHPHTVSNLLLFKRSFEFVRIILYHEKIV